MAFTQPEKAFCVLELSKTDSATLDDRVLLPWYSRSLDITPCDFFLWVSWQHWSMRLPLPKDVVSQGRITEVVATCNHRQHNAGTHFSRNLTIRLMCGVWLTVFTLNIFEHSIKNMRLQAFRIYQMHCYFLNSFWHIQRQNVPKTFGTPCISKKFVDLKIFLCQTSLLWANKKSSIIYQWVRIDPKQFYE